MLREFAAVIGLRITDQTGSKSFDLASLVEPVQSFNGRTLLNQNQQFIVEFPNAFDALNCSLALQRNSNAALADRLFRIAINHRTPGLINQELSGQEIDDIHRLLGRAEDGGICLARTVYDVVRYDIKLKYEAEPDNSDLYFACAIMRQNRRKINLLENSAVRLSRRAVLLAGPDDPADPGIRAPQFHPIRSIQQWLSS